LYFSYFTKSLTTFGNWYENLVSAVDIAVSKIGRLETVDRQDIKALYRNHLFTLKEFVETAEIARDYCTTAINKLEFNIKMAINLLEEET